MTAHSRIIVEDRTVPQLAKMFTAFYGNSTFTTAFTGAHTLSVYWASSIQSTPILFIKRPFNSILPSSPRSSKWSLSLRFPHQNLVRIFPLPHTCQMPLPPPSSRFDQPYNTCRWRAVQIIKLPSMLSPPESRNLIPLGPK